MQISGKCGDVSTRAHLRKVEWHQNEEKHRHWLYRFLPVKVTVALSFFLASNSFLQILCRLFPAIPFAIALRL